MPSEVKFEHLNKDKTKGAKVTHKSEQLNLGKARTLGERERGEPATEASRRVGEGDDKTSNGKGKLAGDPVAKPDPELKA